MNVKVLVICVVAGLIISGQAAAQPGGGAAAGPAGAFSAAVPQPDYELMQELDRLIEQAIQEQAPTGEKQPAPQEQQDNQEAREDGRRD